MCDIGANYIKTIKATTLFVVFLFVHSWEQRKLGELSSLITKGTTPLDKNNSGIVNFVKIESIDESSGDITITQRISIDEHNGYLRRSQLKENDILFSIAGTLGRVTSVKSSILPANTNQALAIIRLKDGCLDYVKTYLKGKAVAEFIKKNPTIGAQPNLSLEQVANLEIAIPSVSEQVKIGNYFEKLDNLITLHQRKDFSLFLQFWEQKQQSFLPISWEQRKFEDLYSYASEGGTPDTNNSSFYKDGTIPFVKIEDTENKYIDSTKSHISVEGLNHSSAWLIPAHNILFTNGATVGNVAINRIPVATKQGILGIIPSKQVTVELMFYLLSSTLFQREVKSRMATGTFATIILKNLNQIPVCIPTNKNEQNLITDYLSQLDNLITLHQRKDFSLFLQFWEQKQQSFLPISWEQRKLGNIAAKVTEKNTQNSIKETFTNSAEMGVVSQRDFFDHDIAKADKIDGYYIVQENDFIYNPRISVTAPCGPINRNKLGRKGVISPLYTIFRTNGINPLFLEWYFKSSCWYAYMYFNGDSGARSDRFSIKNELFFDMPIPLPKDDEQWRIGLLLESLNNLITLHQCKFFYKKIIFKNEIFNSFEFGNSITWEQRKLGDLVKEVTRRDPNSNAPIMMITANNGFIEQSERYAFNNAGESLKKYILLQKGELAYNHGASKLRPYGSCFALTTAENARIPFVYHCFSAERMNPEFLSIELNGNEIESQLRSIVSSGARMDGLLNISFGEYTSVSILFPKKNEQDKIADFFRQLDNLITLHQRIKIFITGDYHDQKNK